MKLAILSLVLCAVVACSAQKSFSNTPVSPNDVPVGYVEPVYASDVQGKSDAAFLEMVSKKQDKKEEVQNNEEEEVNPGDGSIAGAPAPGPGPWLASYHTVGAGGIGNLVPPYAFDGQNFGQMGPYRALTNRFSDGTSYPLNMEKYDFYGRGGDAGAKKL